MSFFRAIESEVFQTQNTVNCIHPTQPNCNHAYIRLKLYSRNVLVNALVDSGNLVDDLMSLDLAQSLKLPLTLDDRVIGTAGAGATLKVMGKAPSMLWYIEGLNKPVLICPLVIDKLSHPLNLGQAFLKRMSAGLQFKPQGGQLLIFQKTIPLNEPGLEVLRPSEDTRFQKCLSEIKARSKQHNKHVNAATEPQVPLEVDADCTISLENQKLLHIDPTSTRTVDLRITTDEIHTSPFSLGSPVLFIHQCYSSRDVKTYSL